MNLTILKIWSPLQAAKTWQCLHKKSGTLNYRALNEVYDVSWVSELWQCNGRFDAENMNWGHKWSKLGFPSIFLFSSMNTDKNHHNLK